MELEQIKVDLENSERYKQDIDENISSWLDEYNGEPYGNEIDGRSQIVWKLIKKHGESLVANLSKPLIYGTNLISLEPRTENDVKKAKLDEKLVNFFFNKDFDKTRFVKNMVRIMVKEGTAFIKVSWEKDKTKNRPFAEVLYNEDVLTDPYAQTIEDSRYVIHRYRVDLDSLKKDPNYDKNAIEKFDRLRKQDQSLGSIDAYSISDDLHDRNLTNYQRKEDNEVFLYEYWYKKDGEVFITSFLNDKDESVIIKEEKYPFDWYPFIAIPFYEEEFKIWGRALADVISDEQKFMTSIVRGVIDNMSLSNNGQKFIRKGALDSVNFKRLMEGAPVVEINTTDVIQNAVLDGHFNELPSSVYNMLQVIENQAEGLTGVSKMMQGLQNVNSSSATETQLMMTQSQIRLLDIENNIMQGLKKLVIMWIDMINKYIDDKQMYQITGTTIAEEKAKLTELLKQKYQVDQLPEDTALKAMQLIVKEVNDVFDPKTAKYDIKVTIGTDGLKVTKINQINMLMQQAGALVQAGAVPSDIIQKLMAKLFELFDYPELAKETEEYKPQPDPMQQQMMQIQLQAEMAKAKKEEALAQNALARTQHTMVKAKKEELSTDADIKNKYADVTKKIAEAQDKVINNGVTK